MGTLADIDELLEDTMEIADEEEVIIKLNPSEIDRLLEITRHW